MLHNQATESSIKRKIPTKISWQNWMYYIRRNASRCHDEMLEHLVARLINQADAARCESYCKPTKSFLATLALFKIQVQ